MKRFLTIAAALALVLGLSQCRKPNAPTINGIGGTQHVVLQASFDNGGSKIAQDGTGLKWEVGDIITVRRNGVALEPGTLECTNAASGTFVGEIAQTTGNITFTFGTENFMNQTGKLNDAIYLTSGDVAYEPSGSYNSVEMKMSQTTALLKLDLSYFGPTDKASDGEVEIYKGEQIEPIATVKGVTTESHNMYVALPADNTEQTYTLTDNNGKTVKRNWTLNGNTFFSAGGGAAGMFATVVTIPVCAIHANCASSGGVVTGAGVEEQGVCWGTSANPTIADNKYIHQYEYATGKLTPKNLTSNNTFTGFMSSLRAGTTYHVRAYVKKGNEVVYGNDETFTTLATEPTVSYVDLGLSVKWATCNMGAAHEYDYGDYYQWGDNAACTGTTTDKMVCCVRHSERFIANNSYSGTDYDGQQSREYTKYGKTTADAKYWYSGAGTPAGTPDNKTQLDDADDCVKQTIGGDWRMPTNEEWNELIGNTTQVWTTSNGVYGYRLTSTKPGYTEKSIFLPAAGYRSAMDFKSADTGGRLYGCYRSSTITSDGFLTLTRSLRFLIDKDEKKSSFAMANTGRCYGYSVRPVCE